MSRPIILESTLDTIDQILLSLSRQRDWPDWYPRYHWSEKHTPSLEAVRNRLLFLNDHLEHFDGRDFKQYAESEMPIDWLYYEDEEDVIPVYDEAVALVVRKFIVPASEIPYVLRYMGISGTKSGIDVDNHDGKGYHFHYGKVKNDSLKRFDVLLTFDKRSVGQDKQPIPDIPLHIESHGTGKYVHIDASTIGHNRRLPIYLVCVNAMNSRGLENFLTPSSHSWQFYPAGQK